MKKIIHTLLSAALIMTLAISCEEDTTVDGEIFDTDFPEDLENYGDLIPYSDLTQVILEDEHVEVEGYTDTYVELNGLSSVTITGDATSIVGSKISLNSIDARLYLPAVSYDDLSLIEDDILIYGVKIQDGKNANVRAYYNYIYIEPISMIENYYPATVSYMNIEAVIEKSTIYTNDKNNMPIGNGMVDKIFLKRGHQIVVAASSDGTVSSRCFVAASNDLTIELDEDLAGKVAFMRCLAIDYVTKRGVGGKSYHSYVPPVDLGWFYTWQTTPVNAIAANQWPIPSDPLTNFLPMFWNSASDAAIQTVIDMEAPIVLFLNEPSNTNQADVDVETALELYEKIHAMGVRLVTPSMREITNWAGGTNTTTTWHRTFMAGVAEKGLRYDGIGLHWYSYTYKNYTDANVAEQSKSLLFSILEECYELYQAPLFMTEFNLEGGGATDYQTLLFFESVLPALEEAEYVERYALFPPGSSVTWFTTGNTLNEYGEAYCYGTPNTPSIVVADDSRYVTSDETDETDETDEVDEVE